MPKKKLYNTNGIVYSTDANFKPPEKNEEEITIPTEEQALKVKLDSKHRAGKMVTVVEGFNGTQNDLNVLEKKIKSFCATGGSVKDNNIIIQGDNKEKIYQWLVRAGYKKTKKY